MGHPWSEPILYLSILCRASILQSLSSGSSTSDILIWQQPTPPPPLPPSYSLLPFCALCMKVAQIMEERGRTKVQRRNMTPTATAAAFITASPPSSLILDMGMGMYCSCMFDTVSLLYLISRNASQLLIRNFLKKV